MLIERLQRHLLDSQQAWAKQLGQYEAQDWQIEEEQHDNGHHVVMHVAGETFERAAINYSSIHSEAFLASALSHSRFQGQPFRAVGLSTIFHPRNPHVPTMHANLRYFQLADGQQWFGGGLDLTPYVLYAEDARHWHAICRSICAQAAIDYETYKAACDAYFYLPHRGEHRGIGGLFIDEWSATDAEGEGFFEAMTKGLTQAYAAIVVKRLSADYDDDLRDFQLLRRGRYVEFNLLYDRGTRFGLEWGSRMEAVLVSMPPMVSWRYKPEQSGHVDDQLMAVLKAPQAW